MLRRFKGIGKTTYKIAHPDFLAIVDLWTFITSQIAKLSVDTFRC